VESLEWNDESIVAVLTKLTRVETPRGQIPVSYRELDEERLGSIYERLLELRLSLAERPMERIRVAGRELVVDRASLRDLSGYETKLSSQQRPLALLEEDNLLNGILDDEIAPADGDDDALDSDADEDIAADAQDGDGATAATQRRRAREVIVVETIELGTPYLASSSGRKETASYYTARDLVDFLVRETIDPKAERAEPAAILRLRVVDPAMGSGHFLIGATRRLADHLLAAYRRSEERDGFDALPPFVQALWENERELLSLCRQLVAVHCLYGVDKNPLAVDLARVALWLATAAADHPLSFLDHRLRCGDSLLGLDVAQIVAVEGTTKGKSKQKSSQYSMLAVGDELVDQIALEHAVQNRLVQAFAVLRGFLAIVDDEREPFEFKRQRADSVRKVLEPLTTLHAARVGRLLSDTEEHGQAAYLGALRTFGTFGYLNDRDRTALAEYVERGAREAAFCWKLEFPDAYYKAREDGSVIERPDAGFDVVIGNPPWDKMLLDKRTYYYRFDPLIVNFQGTSADRRIEAINNRHESAEQLFNIASARLTRYVLALSTSGVFRYQIVKVGGKKTGGHPDTYKYFFERSYYLSCLDGMIGLIIPAAFTNADGSTGLRKLALEVACVQSMFIFENRKKLFPIDSRFKFQTLVMSRRTPATSFEAAFWIHDVEILKLTKINRLNKSFSIRVADLKRASPERLAILELRSEKDFDIVRQMQKSTSTVGSFLRSFGARIGQELNMTNDRKQFHSKRDLIAVGARREGDAFLGSAGERYVPLREGRMVQAFDGNAKRYVSGEGRSAAWAENGWPKEPIEPHYWVREDALEAAWTRGSIKLYWCDVTGATNERTAMAAIVPSASASGHTLAAMYLPSQHDEQLRSAAAILNSFAFDWYIRLSVAQHMSFNFVEPAPFVGSLPIRDVMPMIDRVGSPNATYLERADLRAKLDAAVALAYELSYADLAHVLSSFPLIDRAEPSLEHEERSTITRDLALAAYCRLAGEHDPEHADRVRAARAGGALGYVATRLRAQLSREWGGPAVGVPALT